MRASTPPATFFPKILSLRPVSTYTAVIVFGKGEARRRSMLYLGIHLDDGCVRALFSRLFAKNNRDANLQMFQVVIDNGISMKIDFTAIRSGQKAKILFGKNS